MLSLTRVPSQFRFEYFLSTAFISEGFVMMFVCFSIACSSF